MSPRMEDSSMDQVDVVDATKFWDRSRVHPSKRRDLDRPISSQLDQSFHAILKVSDVKRRIFDEEDSIVFTIAFPALEQSTIFESYSTSG